ncbi:hypothetical protein [Nonomuraea sp. NPDC049480]|uniref:hypothetical protein n=1 Tax=Nonomuraea sp. NPDC049480 TaxID=3364353 RepID=UPI0037957C0E
MARGIIPTVRLHDGRPARVASHHPIGTYLRSALAAGLQVRRREEPLVPAAEGPAPASTGTLGPWDVWPWCLSDLAPEAARAAFGGTPALVIWHFPLTRQPAG